MRFEIAEGNVVSCVGSFGRMRDTLGVPILPMMTVYDFFIKRALDQYFPESQGSNVYALHRPSASAIRERSSRSP